MLRRTGHPLPRVAAGVAWVLEVFALKLDDRHINALPWVDHRNLSLSLKTPVNIQRLFVIVVVTMLVVVLFSMLPAYCPSGEVTCASLG